MTADPLELPTNSDFDRWRQTRDEVVSVLLDYPGRAENLWLREFPSGSCSVASFAIAATLRHRDGEVWALESCFNGDHSHTWLSKDAGTAAHATIDSTLHQFSGLATEPHVGPGPSPVVAAFFEGDAVAVVRADRVPIPTTGTTEVPGRSTSGPFRDSVSASRLQDSRFLRTAVCGSHPHSFNAREIRSMHESGTM